MISTVNKNLFFTKRKELVYADEPSLKIGFLDHYMNSFYTKKKFGFIRFPFYTKIIDISSNDYLKGIEKTKTKLCIKAKEEGILCETSNEIDKFISFYNSFCDDKKLTYLLTKKYLKKYGDALILRKAYLPDGEILVFHLYILDRNIKRVLALHSGSNIHKEITPEKKALIGRANTLLHCEDMKYFKELGCNIYDFGGYTPNTEDKSMQGINRFKDSFGGTILEESDYESIIIYPIKILLSPIKKIAKVLLSK